MVKPPSNSALATYISRMKGGAPPERIAPSPWVVVRTWVVVLGAVGLLSMPHYYFHWAWANDLFIVTAFGSSIVLLFGAPRAAFSQPRNVILGHAIGAICGVAAFKLLGDHQVIACAIALATTVIGMQLAHALHPPSGATALFAVIGGPAVTGLGFWFVVMPILVGMSLLVLLAVLINNAFKTPSHHYPVHWW